MIESTGCRCSDIAVMSNSLLYVWKLFGIGDASPDTLHYSALPPKFNHEVKKGDQCRIHVMGSGA